VRPTPLALAVAAAGLVLSALPALGLPWGLPLWLAFWLLFAAALVADALLAPRVHRLTVEVAMPALLAVDESGEAEVTLRWASRLAPDRFGTAAERRGDGPLARVAARPLAAEAVFDVSQRLEPAPAQRFDLPPGGVVLTVPLVPERRGEVGLDEIWLRWAGPLGLVRRTARRRPAETTRVTPNLRRVGERTLRHLSLRQAMPGQRIERYAGQGTEFHALRDWVSGLDPRHVDWKASARHTRLLARELRAERNHQIVVALDTGRLMAEPVAGAPLLDHALHAALELAQVGLHDGDRVGLYAFDDRPRAFAPPRGGRRALPALVRVASGLDYSDAETSFTLGLTELSRRLHRRSLVVVLTDFVDSITAELMVDNLLRLSRHQLVLFVAFRDPLVGELTAAPPRRRSDLDRAVVAAALARERREVLGRLGKRGIQVVDAVPAEVGPALVDRYLEIKRREMI
jgi:uncharacterized protein (DUF58 family)